MSAAAAAAAVTTTASKKALGGTKGPVKPPSTVSPPDTLRGGSSTTATNSAGPSSLAGTPTTATSREPTWKHHDFYGPCGGVERVQSFELDLDEYFEGPRDIRQFSRWPLMLRLYGSVLPKMILPLSFVGVYAATITALCQYVYDLGIDSILLTVLGFIVGLALSFRFSTAYERYSDGSKYWTALLFNARMLARLIWVFVRERHELVVVDGATTKGKTQQQQQHHHQHHDGEESVQGKADLLGKLSAINLLSAFAVAMKHRLRFEPATSYVDLAPLVRHLDTMAGRADQATLKPKDRSTWWNAGEYLGIPICATDPREILEATGENLGNLPLEMLTYLTTYLQHIIHDEKLLDGLHQGTAMGCVNNLTEIQGGLERISNTPIPVAYSIAIAQVTWVYVLLLPVQLWHFLGWFTIPGTIFAAYIILSFERIGREIEDPFGTDVNDLPLDQYCRELTADFDVLTRAPAPAATEWMPSAANKVLYPLSLTGYNAWVDRSLAEIREALRVKAITRATTRVRTVLPDEETPLLG